MAGGEAGGLTEEELRQEQEEARKPGQKHPTPAPGSGDRVFYESLLEQRPESTMAKQWCVEYGVLPAERAQALYAELLKAKVTPLASANVWQSLTP